MSQRLVTIIDTDVNLASHLQGELARYGLSAEVVVDANDLMTRKDGFPELVVLCIDPKRTGWAVCNRLRKSPMLKSIPLIITSAEATEKDFDDHKKLKTRAEEYLHKPFTVESLIDKISALIQMPEPGTPIEAVAEDVESQEIDIEQDLGDIEVEPEEIGDSVEYSDESTLGGSTNLSTAPHGYDNVVDQVPEEESTRIGFAGEIDGEVDLETNAAFAAIGLDDPAVDPLQHGDGSPFEDDPFGLPEPPPIEPPRARAPTPPPLTSAAAYADSGAIPQVRRDSPADQDSAPVPKLTREELELDEVARDAAEMVSENFRPIIAAAAVTPTPAPVDDRAFVEARQQIEKLQKELDEVRAKSKDAGAATFSREREFLTLRETINKKEKEVLDLKDALDSKDRQILDSKDKLREAERKLREGEEKSLATEREMVSAREKLEALQSDKALGAEREKQVKGRLEDTQKALARAEEEIETWRSKHATDTAALDEKMSQATAKHRDELGQLQKANAEALAQLKTDHTGALAQAKADHDANAQTLADEHTQTVQALRDEHATQIAQHAETHRTTLETELKAAERRQGEAIVELETRHEAALAEQAGKHKEALAAQGQEAHRTLETAMADHVAERARLEADHARAIEALDAQKADELAQQAERAIQAQTDALTAQAAEHEAALKSAREAHSRKLQALEESHDDLKAGMQARHATQVEDLRKQHQASVAEWETAIAERDTIIGQQRDRGVELEAALATEQATSQSHARRIEALEDELHSTQTALVERTQTVQARDGRIAELEQESARYQDQILRAYQRIKNDESTVQRARKALAIALTLLEESEPESDEAAS